MSATHREIALGLCDFLGDLRARLEEYGHSAARGEGDEACPTCRQCLALERAEREAREMIAAGDADPLDP